MGLGLIPGRIEVGPTLKGYERMGKGKWSLFYVGNW